MGALQQIWGQIWGLEDLLIDLHSHHLIRSHPRIAESAFPVSPPSVSARKRGWKLALEQKMWLETTCNRELSVSKSLSSFTSDNLPEKLHTSHSLQESWLSSLPREILAMLQRSTQKYSSMNPSLTAQSWRQSLIENCRARRKLC